MQWSGLSGRGGECDCSEINIISSLSICGANSIMFIELVPLLLLPLLSIELFEQWIFNCLMSIPTFVVYVCCRLWLELLRLTSGIMDGVRDSGTCWTLQHAVVALGGECCII